MGPRQTVVNKLRNSTGSRSKSEAGRASATAIGTGVGERPGRGGPRRGPRADQDIFGLHLATTSLSLRLRVAQHLT